MKMSWITKTFSELTTTELYEILRLRAEVFVVEQNCVYQDIDEKDKKAIHIFNIKDQKICAYARIFKAGDYFDIASIGRVVVDTINRNTGLGHELMNICITTIQNTYNSQIIKISAQLYLKSFYESHDFQQEGKDYLEDGIPHIAMIRKKST